MRLSRLPEVRSRGDLVWFQPALDRLRALRSDPDPRAQAFFTADSPLYVARAPGRLDVMGGIADYSGASVLELPLDRSTWAILQPHAGSGAELLTRREGRWDWYRVELPLLLTPADVLAEWFTAHEPGHWAAYVVGVLHQCLHLALERSESLPGFRLLLDSTVPEGKGVASSAALEVASLAVIAAHLGVELTPERLAAECQWAENHIVGAPCGIMDQMTSACGRRDRLLHLRCQPGTIEGYLEIPSGYRCYGIDSGIRHAVSGADYGTVRTAAFMGYRMIAAAAGLPVRHEHGRLYIDDVRWGGYLANLTPDEFSSRFERELPAQMPGAEFLQRFGGITDPVTEVHPERSYPVRQATAHPILEQQRVERFAELLGALPREPGAAAELGDLMYSSHRSYSACGLGSGGTDRLVDLVAAAGQEQGLFGAKITGGGSGGTVALFGTSEAAPLVRDIAARYGGETGRSVSVFADSGPGAEETGLLLLDPEK